MPSHFPFIPLPPIAPLLSGSLPVFASWRLPHSVYFHMHRTTQKKRSLPSSSPSSFIRSSFFLLFSVLASVATCPGKILPEGHVDVYFLSRRSLKWQNKNTSGINFTEQVREFLTGHTAKPHSTVSPSVYSMFWRWSGRLHPTTSGSFRQCSAMICQDTHAQICYLLQTCDMR